MWGVVSADIVSRVWANIVASAPPSASVGAMAPFAEYLTLPVADLHVVPASLTDEQAVFTEPLAAAFEILEQIFITPADARDCAGGWAAWLTLCLWCWPPPVVT